MTASLEVVHVGKPSYRCVVNAWVKVLGYCAQHDAEAKEAAEKVAAASEGAKAPEKEDRDG